MGNLYNKSKYHQDYECGLHFQLDVDNLNVGIDKKPTQMDERSQAVFKYKTPHFRASADVIFPPLNEGEVWKVGWIQACTHMEFTNKYGKFGISSWEFPDLKNSKKSMISDSDGKNFPWYGGKSETALIMGPKQSRTSHTISMNDNFYPHVTWDIPTSSDRIPKLTKIKRDQSFLTWLVAMDVINCNFVVLKTFRWRMKLEIAIDPTKENGQRSKLVSDPNPEQPVLLDKNVKIPDCAFYPPNANGSQVLVWRAKSTKSLIVVPSNYVSLQNQLKIVS